MQSHITTPFGRRSLSLAMVARQTATQEFASRPEANETIVHKWRLFRALTEAKTPLGVTDRALSVLHALLSFHQETALSLPERGAGGSEGAAASRIVVFPSNKELSIRAHGMAPATLRRHIAMLVEAGLILRRDSPNGKRFARRGQSGAIEDAFGFDLTPLVARAAEIENLAEEVRAENRAIALLRERVTLIRRDIVKMIETALEEGVLGDWEARHGDFRALSARLLRKMPRADLEALAADLATLATEIHKALENHIKRQNMRGNESQSERHIQNQITNLSDLEPRLQKGGGEAPGAEPEVERMPSRAEPTPVPDSAARPDPQRPGPCAFPLGMVLDACPDIVDFAPGGVSSWRDLATAAATARRALGVSPDAFAQAVEVLGGQDASVVVAAILQRGDEIKSAGGYLRALTTKAREGAFSLGPVLMALLRGRAGKAGPERRRAG